MMSTLPINPGITDVVKAYKFLRGRVRHTPTEYSHALSVKAGAPVYLKLENQQLCGSFKLRGALYKMNSLTPEERALGVVTCSSGNHGQGVAMAAQELKIKTKIFVPNACPETKKEAIRWRGGDFVELIVADGDYDFTEKTAHEYAAAHGVTYVSSFEDAAVVAGQGTAGGGGLMNGIAIAAKALNPDVEIWGVQTDTSNPWVVSWEEGRVKEVEYGETLADGLAGGIPQSLLSLAKLRVKGILEVTEAELAAAIAFVHREQHMVIEGAGAVGIAALLAGKAPVRGRKTGIVISGGNIDETKLLKVLAENN